MKKLYTLAIASLLSSLSWGQYEVHLLGNTTDISGTVHYENDIAIGSLLVTKFYFKNVSGSSHDVKVTRLRLDTPVEWTDGLCWGPIPDPNFQGGCYGEAQMPTNPWTTPDPASTIPDGMEGELISDVHVDNVIGGGLYRYYFSEGNTLLDSIDLHVNATAGINEPEPVQLGMTAYPNPASSTITVNTVGISGDYSVRVTDVLGKVVYTDEAGAIEKIDVSNFKNGVYLISVSENGEAIQTRRIVVKH